MVSQVSCLHRREAEKVCAPPRLASGAWSNGPDRGARARLGTHGGMAADPSTLHCSSTLRSPRVMEARRRRCLRRRHWQGTFCALFPGRILHLTERLERFHIELYLSMRVVCGGDDDEASKGSQSELQTPLSVACVLATRGSSADTPQSLFGKVLWKPTHIYPFLRQA